MLILTSKPTNASVPVQLDTFRFQVFEATLLSIEDDDGIGDDQATLPQILKHEAW